MRPSSPRLAALFLGMAVVLGADVAHADGLGWVDQRQRLQSERIDWQSSQGRLSSYERYRLTAGAARIERLQQAARRDGTLDLSERAHLGSMLDRQSRAIYNLSND